MGTEEVRGYGGAESINEERKEDGGCGALNKELSEVEEDLKGMRFYDMEGRGSVMANNSGEVCDFQLYFGDG